MSVKERTDESLCEKSMKVVTSIIKLSAFSIAKMSLGATTMAGNPVASKSLQPTTDPFVFGSIKQPVLRSQEPQTSSNQTFLVEPQGTYHGSSSSSSSSSSYVIKEDMNVDGRASDYIRKVREKNQKDLSVISENTSSYTRQRHRFVN